MWVDGSPKRYSAWEGDDFPRGRLCAALEDSAGERGQRAGGAAPPGGAEGTGEAPPAPQRALRFPAGFMSWEDDSCGDRKPFVCKYRAQGGP